MEKQKTEQKSDKEKQNVNDQQHATDQNEAGQPELEMQEDMETAEGLEEEAVADEKDEIIEKLTRELEQAKEAVLRKAAESENLRKRLQKEKIKIFQDSKKSAVESFLPIRDDLKRSLQASEHINVDKGFISGIQMVAEKFEKVLSEFGVEAIDEEMVPFDVDVHDAMLKQPSDDDSVEPNTVLKVIEPGYKIENRVIKHAKVIVSQ